MNQGNTSILSANEAAKIATNAYFTLNNWLNHSPKKGAAESRANLHNRVLGANPVQSNHSSKSHADSSLHSNALKNAQIGRVHHASTGWNTKSGFGYTLTFNRNGQSHLVIAVRGTRPELKGLSIGIPDLMTDLHASYTPFDDFGSVHTGFKNTVDSLWPSIVANGGMEAINSADVVHCVGHSLGGAVATLIAARLSQSHSGVKLYTFGSPRVGHLWTSSVIEAAIGESNIYRVAHDLDLITLIGPYPFTHVLPTPGGNNFTLASPKRVIGLGNHDMGEYIAHTDDGDSWEELKGAASFVRYQDAILVRMMFGSSNADGVGSWVQRGCRKTLSMLLKLIGLYLEKVTVAAIDGLTGIDKFCALLVNGATLLKKLPSRIVTILKHIAVWSGIQVVGDFTADVIRSIVEKVLAAMRSGAKQELAKPNSTETGMPLDLDVTDSREI